MDYNNGRSQPQSDSGDWRTELLPESRQRIANKIMETLKRHLPFSGEDGLVELKRIAVRFEEKIYNVATSQADYLRKISLKMITMETEHQNPIHINPNGSRPARPEPAVDSGDWRTQLEPESRQRIANKIMETLKRHLPFSGRKVRDVLPIKLLSFLRSYQSRQNGPGTGTTCFKGDPKKSDGKELEKGLLVEDKLNYTWREAFLKSYKAMDKELRSHPNLDCFCSGSTAVTIVKQGLNLFMGYIGDSRAILGSKDSNNSMVATQLTVDLKPDLPREAERIKRCKGRVFALQDEPEVSRVWMPFDDAPGLAMARAFGDFCLKEYGVISIPEFSHRLLTERDQFVVIASDGVWDVLSNEEVVAVVSSAPSRASAAKMVADSAAQEWKLKYPTSKMDDCAVVCLFLDKKMDSGSDNHKKGFSVPINHPGDDTPKPDPVLQRNSTVRPSGGSGAYGETSAAGEAEDQGWSGLEGVVRVNSLVQLPRFSEERPKDPNQ